MDDNDNSWQPAEQPQTTPKIEAARFSERTDQIDKLAGALAKAQGEFTEPKENCKVDYTTKAGQRLKYDYADLASVMQAIRPSLSKYGLSLVHLIYRTDRLEYLQTMLMHESGQSLSSYYPIGNASIEDPKVFGGKLSYARRYTVAALVGVSSESGNDLNEYDTVKRESVQLPPKPPTTAPRAGASKNEAPAGQGMLRAITAAAAAKKVTEPELAHYFKSCYPGLTPSTLKKWQADEILAFIEDPNTTAGQVMMAAEKAKNQQLARSST